MSMPDHFWSVVNVDSNIYFGGLETSQTYLSYRGRAPFVTQPMEGDKRVQSLYHIYALCQDLTPEDQGVMVPS
jgi:hypothetical protein